MIDAIPAGAARRPIPTGLVTAGALVTAVLVLTIMTGAMFLPAHPSLPVAAAAIGTLAGLLIAKHMRLKTPDVLFGMFIGSILSFALVTVATTMRGDGEIEPQAYSAIAARLRERPEIASFLADARADGVITRDEVTRFYADVEAFDRRKALGR